MARDIKIEGLDEFVKDFRGAHKEMTQIRRKFLISGGLIIERNLKINSPVDRGQLQSNIGRAIVGTHIMAVTPLQKYAKKVVYGTPSAPNLRLDDMLDWARRKGLGADSGRIIYNYVRKYGQKPNDYITKAVNDSEKPIHALWSKTVNKINVKLKGR